jgi:hypothetical protein
MAWRRVVGGRRVGWGSEGGGRRVEGGVPELWGGGNASSLMEARRNAKRQAKDEGANARKGFTDVLATAAAAATTTTTTKTTGNPSRQVQDHSSRDGTQGQRVQFRDEPQAAGGSVGTDARTGQADAVWRAVARRIGLNPSRVSRP